MMQWRVSGHALVHESMDPRALGPEEIRVQVEAAALLAGDLEPRDVAGGSSAVGTVIATGEAAAALQGLRVMVPSVNACGECATCQRGLAPVCAHAMILGETDTGALAAAVTTRARWAVPLTAPLELDDVSAAMAAGPLLHAYGLLTVAGVSAGEVMVVVGADCVSQTLVRMARARGAKVAHAESADRDAIESQLRDKQAHTGPRKVFLATAGEAAIADLASPGSVLVLRCPAPAIAELAARALTVIGFVRPHPELLAETAALVVKRHLALEGLYSELELGSDLCDRTRNVLESGRAVVVRRA